MLATCSYAVYNTHSSEVLTAYGPFKMPAQNIYFQLAYNYMYMYVARIHMYRTPILVFEGKNITDCNKP